MQGIPDPEGFSVNRVLPSLRFLNSNRVYFQTHTLKEVPDHLHSRVGELYDTSVTEDVMYAFHKVVKMINEAQEYVWIMSNQVLMSTMEPLHKAFKRGVEFKLIVPRDIQPPEEFIAHTSQSSWNREAIEARVHSKCRHIVEHYRRRQPLSPSQHSKEH